MSVTQESLDAYDSLPKGMVAERTLKVRDYIAAHPGVTNEGIARGMHIIIQSVTPMTFALKHSGQVWITGRSPTDSGRTAQSMEVARCPVCGSAIDKTEFRGPGMFDYHCKEGHRFRADSGPRCDSAVEVMTYQNISR